MSTVPGRTAEDLLALVDAIVYADGFDSGVTLDEAHRYARVPIAREALREALHRDPALRAVVVERDGVYALRGREELLALRAARLAHARQLAERGRRVARVAGRLPFVRAVALTGSVAAGDAGAEADVDLLVIVSDGRLGTVFLVLGTASRLIGRRVLCPNYYLSEAHLELDRRTLYVGRELAQARDLVGDIQPLRDANPWLRTMFPNLELLRAHARQEMAAGPVRRTVERALSGRLGRALERRARRVAHARLSAHHAGVVPPGVAEQLDRGIALRFHASEVDRTAPGRYAICRSSVAETLAEELGPVQRERSV